MRAKAIEGVVKVKVYAVALCVDANGAKATPGAADDLMKGKYDRTVAIQLVRDVGSDTFWNALADALQPRMGKAAFETSDASKKLRSFFQSAGKLSKGARVTLAWRGGGSELHVSANGKSACIQGAALTRALFGVYLGEGAIAPTAKQSFAAGVRAL